MVSEHQPILGSGFNQVSTSHQEMMKTIDELKELIMNMQPISNSSSDQHRPPPAPPHPQLHPFYTSQVSPPSIIPQFHTTGGIAPQVFDEYFVRSCVTTHTPAAYTSPYNLAVQTTLSTGQPFYVIESTTAEGYENVSAFGELRHVNTWFNTGSETVESTCEIVDKIETKSVTKSEENTVGYEPWNREWDWDGESGVEIEMEVEDDSESEVGVAASDLRELGSNEYHPYLIKRLISIAMDRHDKEKERASVLLSALYADVISSTAISQGVLMLLESADDLSVDILDAVDTLVLFVARAVVDDILPPAFVARARKGLQQSSKGFHVLQTAEKSYLSAPHHAELVERRWGGSTHVTVEEVKKRISDLLREYVESGDPSEACRCIRQLGVAFFHHEVVKRALVLAMETRTAEPAILKLLQEAADEGLISSSQMLKGFTRLAESLDDLAIDIPSAKTLFESRVLQAVAGEWLDASFLKSLENNGEVQGKDSEKLKLFVSIIKEHVLLGTLQYGIVHLHEELSTINEYIVRTLYDTGWIQVMQRLESVVGVAVFAAEITTKRPALANVTNHQHGSENGSRNLMVLVKHPLKKEDGNAWFKACKYAKASKRYEKHILKQHSEFISYLKYLRVERTVEKEITYEEYALFYMGLTSDWGEQLADKRFSIGSHQSTEAIWWMQLLSILFGKGN